MSEGCVHVEDVELTNGLLKTAKKIFNKIQLLLLLLLLWLWLNVLLYFTTLITHVYMYALIKPKRQKKIKTVRLSFNYVIDVETEKQEDVCVYCLHLSLDSVSGCVVVKIMLKSIVVSSGSKKYIRIQICVEVHKNLYKVVVDTRLAPQTMELIC
ncbi:hypothetical protein T02_5854 [Trichinella nativa]|uniref:Uncharacterized protein n=1 Tax=Trichinella nativa TaxID=6335 RepID=A0A0V1LSG3_9BILA|nr:hypothetical protein T02_5854 [Trichinella nativa]